MRNSLSVLICILACLFAGIAHGQTSEADRIAAEALFTEGRKLMTEGRVAEACERFARSNELDSAPGTLLNLGECYEKLGRTASAWATFRSASALARARGQDERERYAAERAARLEPDLARLAIDVPEESRIEGLRIRRGDANVERAVWGVAVPVDPGELVIEATAPGRRPWKQTLTIARAANDRVAIPLLEVAEPGAPTEDPAEPAPLAVEPMPTAPPPADTDAGSSQRLIGLVVGGAGVVALAVGGVLALSASSKNQDSKAFCRTDDPNRCSAEGVALREDAQSAGTLATIVGGVGLAALTGGAILYFTAPTAAGTPTGAVVSFGGSF